MKTPIHFSCLWLPVLAGIVLGALGGGPGLFPARAGLTLEMNVIRYDQNGYYFYPNLTTNSTPPDISFGDYFISSANSPTNGSSVHYHFDTNGFNQGAVSLWGYGDFDSMKFQLTNGNWFLSVTNATTTNVYLCQVTANIDSNALPPVTIMFPADHAMNVTNQPTFAWQGPTNYSGVVVYAYNASANLPATQTSWPSPLPLYQGLNNFTVHYDSNAPTAVVASVPRDAALNAISGWVSTTHLQDYRSSQFTVGTVDPSGTSHFLVAHYPWDGTNGDGTASGADTSGNGYNINFGGSYGSQGGVNSITAPAAGPRAIQFHNGDGGSAGYVGWSPTPPGLLSALAGSFSISCWIKTTQSTAWDDAPAYYGAGIVSADNSGLANDVIPLALTGSKIGFNTGGDTEDVTLNSSAAVNDGNYHHVVVTRNQATGQKIIYIDGVLDSFSSGTRNLLSDPRKLTLGALADAGNADPNDGSYYNGFNGELDDLQVYSGVLSAGEVAGLFASPGTTAPNGGGSFSAGHSIVARYDFEQTNSPGVDSSGRGNDSNCGGGDGNANFVDTFSSDAAVGNYARDFLGHTFICFTPAAASFTNLALALSGSFSVSAWVKTTQSLNSDDAAAISGANILFAENANTNSTMPLALTGSKVAISVNDHNGGRTTLHSQTSVNDGRYHQIAVTRNQADGVMKVYVDGNLDGTATGSTDRLYIPSFIALGGYFNDYNGLLDDVQIYSGVLSDAEVAGLFAHPGTVVPDVAGGGGGPVVHYDFNEGTVLAADVSGNGNNMVHAGNFGGLGPQTSSDAAAGSGAVSFEGGSYLTASSNLLTTLAGNFTLSLWLKTSQSYGNQGDLAWAGAGVLSADSPNSGAKDLIPVALTGGQVAFNIGDGNSDNTINSSATVNDDVWHHVVVTRSQSTGARQIYIDGALDSSDLAATVLLNDPVLLTIGAKSDASDPDPASPDYNGSNGYEGLLDDMQIYPRVLQSSEVAFLYHNPGAVIGGSAFGDALNAPNLTWTTGGGANWFVETTNTYDGVSALQSGAIGDSQTNWIQTTVPASGALAFYWKVSSEQDFDFLHFYINGVERDAISGEVDWTQKTYSVAAGDTLRWEYTKDDGLSAGLDAGFLDQVSYIPNTGPDFNAALGTTNWNWSTTGNARWFVESTNSHDGYFAAQSGSVTNGQTSRLQSTVTGPGTLSFWWTTVDNYDGFGLEFAMDGNYYDNISGNGGFWQHKSGVFIPAGQHTLYWTAYGGESLTNSGFLDEVSLTADYAPQIYSGPLDGTATNVGFNSTIPVLLGSNTVLVVQVSGSPPPTLRWYHNGALITNATSATLTITNTQFSDAGYYQLTASNYLATTASSYVNLKVYQRTDLQPLSFSVPPVVSSSSLVPTVWTVTNTGPATVNQFYDSLDFSAPVVTPYYSLSSLWAVYNTVPTPPASVYITTNTTHRFPSVPAGNYTVVLTVDAYNSIIETNENNNSLTNVPITVINPDMQPGNFRVATITNLGQSVLTFTYNITNNGPGILDGAPFYDQVFLSTNSTLDDSAIAVKQVDQAPSIPVGGYRTTTNSFTVPIVPSGDYYLIVHVDHYGFFGVGYIWEVSETNNYAVVPVHLIQSDLVPTNLTAPAFVSSRQSVPIHWEDFNQGDGLATNMAFFNLFDTLYLSTNQTVSPGAIKLGTFYSADFTGHSYYQGDNFYWNQGVAPGQAFTNVQNVIIPNAAAGNYYLVLSVDVNNAIREIVETNNSVAQPITLGTLDLMPTAFSAPSGANARSTIPVTWAVTNQGTGTVYPQWVDRIFISTNAFFDASAVKLGEFVQSNAVAGGSAYSMSNTVTLNGLGAGNYYLLLFTDAATNVMEINHGNNVLASPLTINSPDLIATALTIAPSYSSQQPFSPVYSVSNAGPVTAYAGWSDRLFLSPDGILETNNLLIGELVPGLDLPVNNSYSELVNTAVPSVPAGDYFVLLQANANQFFAENNLANNLLARPVHINNPDLVVTNFLVPATIVLTQYYQRFEADWVVQNQGAGDAQVHWVDYVYLSPTNVLNANAVGIGSFGENPVFGSGQSYLGYANAYLPNGIQGPYNVILNVNEGHVLYESSYTNNVIVRPVNLVVPPVPVLSVVTVDSPGDAWSGQQIYVTWTLTNSGTAAVSGSFYDVAYLCSSSAGANLQPYGSFQFTGQILPGQSIVRQQKISLPISLQGTFWVAVHTDINYDVFEFNYRTNDFLVASHPLVVHLTPTPNLQIASIVAPTNMFSGGEGTVSWIETNSGSGPTSAPFWDDAVYLCDSSNYYTASYRVSLGAPNNVAYLNPGDSYAGSQHVTLPRGITGTFYFIVWADIYNNVFEGTNENDNWRSSAPVFVAPSPVPDLQVTTVQPPHDTFSGQPVSVTYAVTNFGLGQTQPTEVQWSDRVYISTNTTLDSSATYLGDVIHNGGLTPSAGYATTASLTLPIGISGDWYFIVTADIFNQVYEAAFEDNNARTAAYVTHIALTPPPDLVTTITQAPTNALSGHVLSVTYTVFNNGTTITPNAGWNDNLYFWTNSVFDAAHAYYQTTFQHYGVLPPGAGYTNTISVVLPANQTGTNFMFVQADAYNAVFELNKTNNLVGSISPVVIQVVPSDLAVTSLSAPATANAGAGILVNWAVTNLGPGDTAVSYWSDRLILSQNILPGAPSDVQLLQVQHNGLLGAGDAYAATNQIAQIPTYVAAGNYQLFLVADAGQNVTVETNRANNLYGPVPITITTHSPDLQIVTATAPTNAVSGSTVTVNWLERNAGDLPANVSYWYDTVYLTANGLLDNNAIYLGAQQNVRPLLSGQTYTNSLSVALPVNIQSNYFFVVIADGFNFIPEAGAENNNVYVINPPVFIALSPVPDLAVTSVITPTTANAGQNFQLSWVVKNVGSANATAAWYDTAYLSADQILDPSVDTYLGYTYQNHNLAPGDSYTNTASFPIPQGLSGPFYVFVTTDPGHSINERGQLTNNTAYNPQAMQVQLLPPVDLVAGQVTIPVNAVPGRNMTVSYTVLNQGANTALGSWTDTLFISADTNWDVGDPLFASVIHNGDVPPGGSYTNTITAPLPGVLPGDYHVIIRSDILNHLTEANKSNNIAASLNSASVDVQKLVFDTPAGDTIGSGQSAYYKLDVTNGQTIHLQFTSTAFLSDNEIFLKFGQMPDSGNFDVAANAPFVANPEIYFAATNTGTYYLLVKCNYAAVPTPYTVLAEVLPFTVRAVQPNIAGDVGTTTFFVRGALFDTNTQFDLQQADRTLPAQSVYLADSTAAYVTFNMNGTPDGNWDFQAVMRDTASNAIATTLTNAVVVGSADPVEPDVSIDGPLAVREPSLGYVTHSCLVDYGNSGYSDLAPPLILVQSRDGTVLGTTTGNMKTNTLQLIGRSLVGPPEILRPQTYATKVIYYRGGGTHLEVWTLPADSTRELTDADWQDIENSVRPPNIADADWLNFWVNIRPRLGSTWGDYVQFVGRVAKDFPAEEREVSALFLSLYTNAPGYRASSLVAGTLVGAGDGLPQTNMTVALMTLETTGYGGAVVARAQTDAAGHFTFPFVPAGKYFYAVSDHYFDMDHDGMLDTNLAGILITNSDMPNQLISLAQPPTNTLSAVTNQESATLALDSEGVLHAFWYRDNALWHAWKSAGQWVDAGIITSHISGSFAVGAGPKLLDGSHPGMLVAWSADTAKSIEILYSVGTRDAHGGFQWSAPAAMTDDAIAQNASPAVAVQPNGKSLVTYLKLGPAAQDDSDVYYSTLALSTNGLTWSAATAPLIQPYDFTGGGASLSAISFGYKKDFKFDLGSYDLGLSMAMGVNGGVSGCQANAAGTASFGISASTAQLGASFSADAAEKFAWQINPEQCAWEFKSAGFDLGGKIDLELKGAVSFFLDGFPHPVPRAIGAGIDRMTDWAKARGYLIENSVGVGAGLRLTGMAWTHPPAPVPEWRDPDIFGRAIATVNAKMKLGVKRIADADQVMEYTQGGQSYNYIVPGLHTNESKTTFALEGQAQIEAVFELYPSLHIRSLTPSGTLKFSVSPFFSYTYPIAGTPIVIDHTAPQPRGGPGSDPLPEGWYFTYDPAAFVGTTNTYGTNSVLNNVANDLYQDGAPALAVDTNGIPYQVWYKFVDPYAAHPGSEINVADFNGTNWSAPTVIPGSLGLNSYVTAATDGGGQRLAVWVHGDSSGINTNMTYDGYNALHSSNDVYFAVFDGSSWSTPAPVLLTPGMDADLRVSRKDNGDLLAVWIYTGTNGVQHLVSSSWDGKGWDAATEITAGSVSAPTAQQAAGVTYLLWTQEVNTNHDRTLYSSQNTGAGWSAAVPFTPTLLVTSPAPALVSARVTDTQLEAIQVVREQQHKACCKCVNGVKTIDANKNLGCGIASIEYNYETCHRIFTYQPCQVRPSDPNNIVGPDGFGPERWVPAGSPLAYTIQFENDPVLASAPATRVTITLPLDANFDPRSFRLGDFGFGGLIFNIPAGKAFYQTRLDLTATKGFYVDLIAGVDIVKRQAFWTLTTIDPATGDVPQNALVGFLPPNHTPPEGDGFVSCSITPLVGVTNGVPVAAKATIVFDNQPPMDTPYALNTLQTAHPASSVLPLPAVTLSPTFDVTWQGAGTGGGSGVSSYDIYASENGSVYYPWVQGTTLNHAPFVGQPGGTYTFYSIAHDNVGNVQATPTNADAFTFVSSNLPPVLAPITNVLVAPDHPVVIHIQATDPNGDNLTYSLVNAPTNATLVATNGLFCWQPTRTSASTTNWVTVAVTDNGVPPLGTNQTFTITVLDFLELSLGETNLQGGGSAAIPVALSSSDGVTNLVFAVQVPAGVLTNWSVAATAPQIGTASLQDHGTNILITLTTASGQSLLGTQPVQVSTLAFSALTNQVSGFIKLPITSVSARSPGGAVYVNTLTNAGTVILVQNQPLMRAGIGPDLSRSLQLYGKLGTNYQVMFNTNLALLSGWQPLLTYTQTNSIIKLPLDSSNPVIFYRLRQP